MTPIMTNIESKPQKTVSILVPMPAETAYSYSVPDDMNVKVGSIVRVPLGPREVAGLVTNEANSNNKVAAKKLRPISEVFDCPPLPADMMRFIHFVSDYTLSPPGMVARMALRVPAAFDPEPAIAGLRYCGGKVEKMTAARKRVLELAQMASPGQKRGLPMPPEHRQALSKD